jgi:hypothetical protein
MLLVASIALRSEGDVKKKSTDGFWKFARIFEVRACVCVCVCVCVCGVRTVYVHTYIHRRDVSAEMG